MSTKERELPLEDPPSPAFVHDSLIEHAGAEIARLLRHFDLRGDWWRRIDPGDAVSRRQRLRETTQVENSALAIVGFDRTDVRFSRRVFEVQFAIWIVFDD